MAGSKDTAIQVRNISKRFLVPHEKHATMKAAALNIFNKRSYRKFQALNDVSFDVRQGEFFGIIGKNGSGKSTLLKIIAGIYLPTSGSVDIYGRISPFLELGVGFNPELTARDNVFLGGSILGLTRRQIEEKFDEIVSFSELEDFIDLKFKNFSSGMQVRLAFSLAIHAHAEILLMDEVLAVGDANFQNKCIEEFNKYRSEGKTIVLVTHDIDVVQRYCDRAILLRDGVISKIGKPEDVGNEYTHQNMSDEEKSRRRLEMEASGQHINSKVRIADVKTLGDAHEDKHAFETGETLIIQVQVESERAQQIDVAGCIKTMDDRYIAGFSTRGESVRVDQGTNYFDYRIPQVPLMSGGYYVNIELLDSQSYAILDLSEKARNFKIYSNFPNKDGLILLTPGWERNDAQAAPADGVTGGEKK